MAKSSGQPVVGSFDDGPDGEVPRTDAGLIVANGGTVQQTRTKYQGAIAVQRMRDPERVLAACLKEARLCGPDFYYRWSVNDKNSPTGKSIIEGTSIDGAMILVRQYGNCAVPVEIASESPQAWILEATFVDFETGFNLTRLFRQRRNQNSSAKMDQDRALDIAFQIGQSKAQRNVVVKAMPIWLLKGSFNAAVSVEVDRYKVDTAKHAERFVEAYARIDVTVEQLEKRIGRKVTAWTAEDVALLASTARAIKEGVTSAAQEFEPVTTESASVPGSQPAASAEPAAAREPDIADTFGADAAQPKSEPKPASQPPPAQQAETPPADAAPPADEKPKKGGGK